MHAERGGSPQVCVVFGRACSCTSCEGRLHISPASAEAAFFSSSDACLIKAYLIRLACMEMRNSLWWLHSWKRIHNSWQETFNKVISGKSLSIEFKILAINIPNAPGASVCIVCACFLQRQQSIFDEIEEYFIC